MIYTEISWSVQAGYPILATLQLLPLAVMVLLLLQGATLGIFCAYMDPPRLQDIRSLM